MDDADLFATLIADIDAVEATLGGAHDAPVDGCPGYRLDDLVDHLGRVFRNVTDALRTPTAVAKRWLTYPPAPRGAELAPWFRGVADGLVAELRAGDLDEVQPCWAGLRPRRFWLRRMTQETAVHRWDAQHAVGPAGPIAAPLAADGIDEYLNLFVNLRLDPTILEGHGETIALRVTDAVGSWSVTLHPAEVDVASTAEGQAATRVSGAAMDLLLALWGRTDDSALDVAGDPEPFRRWCQRVSF